MRNLTITSASFINQYPSTTADDQSQQQARQHQPNQAGFVETLTLDLTRHEEDDNDENSNEEKHHLLTACKIRSIDSNNNTSPWSPILTIRLDKQVQYAPELRLYRGGGGGAGAAGHGDDLANHSSAVEEALRSVEQKESLYSRFFIGFLGIFYIFTLSCCSKSEIFNAQLFNFPKTYYFHIKNLVFILLESYLEHLEIIYLYHSN